VGDGNEVGRGMEVADGIAAKVEATASRICVWGSGVAAFGVQDANRNRNRPKVKLRSGFSFIVKL